MNEGIGGVPPQPIIDLRRTERECRMLPDEELAHARREHQRFVVGAAEEVAEQHPELLPSEALALVEEWRQFSGYIISVVENEQARRRRAATLGVPIDLPRFDDTTLDRIREAVPVDVLAVEELGAVLDKRGRGACPWCGGGPKSQRFAAYVRSGRVICYSCGFSADAIGIVQAARGVGFAEAVRILADRAGVVVSEGGRR